MRIGEKLPTSLGLDTPRKNTPTKCGRRQILRHDHLDTAELTWTGQQLSHPVEDGDGTLLDLEVAK
jgi:hypothetical protein